MAESPLLVLANVSVASCGFEVARSVSVSGNFPDCLAREVLEHRPWKWSTELVCESSWCSRTRCHSGPALAFAVTKGLEIGCPSHPYGSLLSGREAHRWVRASCYLPGLSRRCARMRCSISSCPSVRPPHPGQSLPGSGAQGRPPVQGLLCSCSGRPPPPPGPAGCRGAAGAHGPFKQRPRPARPGRPMGAAAAAPLAACSPSAEAPGAAVPCGGGALRRGAMRAGGCRRPGSAQSALGAAAA